MYHNGSSLHVFWLFPQVYRPSMPSILSYWRQVQRRTLHQAVADVLAEAIADPQAVASEGVIGSLNRIHILQKTLPLTLLPLIDYIMIAICVINYMNISIDSHWV